MSASPADKSQLIPVISGPSTDPYQHRVEQTYDDSPELWKTVLGEELWFQFGIYDSSASWSLDESGRRYFEQQLDLAGFTASSAHQVERILDIGFGWGSVLEYLALRYPHCPRFDGVNVSTAQTHYAARRLAASGLSDRVHLYQCNAQDICLLPDPDHLYDLVILRGSITHFSFDVLEATMKNLATMVRPGGTVVISDSLYNVPLDRYRSALPDAVDRLACGYRKSVDHIVDVLERNSFSVHDVRKLPSNQEVIRWLAEVKDNIEVHPSDELPQALVELRDTADNWSVALGDGTVSVYSIIAKR